MAIFAFEGIQTGKKISGEIDGGNIKEA